MQDKGVRDVTGVSFFLPVGGPDISQTQDYGATPVPRVASRCAHHITRTNAYKRAPCAQRRSPLPLSSSILPLLLRTILYNGFIPSTKKKMQDEPIGKESVQNVTIRCLVTRLIFKL